MWNSVLLAMYSSSALLEMAGIASVALDLRASAQAARAWRGMAPAENNDISFGQISGLRPLMDALAGPQTGRRWAGLAALVIGLLVGTGANVLSLYQ